MLLQNWFINIDQGHIHSVVYLHVDLSKAFYTVDHSILVRKLSMYGMEYTNITRMVQILFMWSTTSMTVCCKLLFKPRKLESPRAHCCFLSTSTIFQHVYSIQIQECTVCRQFKYNYFRYIVNIKNWLLANKLSINVTKTEHMFIASDSKRETMVFCDNVKGTGRGI